MYSLLHFHFESTLRAIACSRPYLINEIHRIYSLPEYLSVSPSQRLNILEKRIKELSESNDIFTIDVFRKVVKNFLGEMADCSIEHVDLRLGVISKKWKGIKDFRHVKQIFEEELKSYRHLSLSFLGAINFSKSFSELDEIFDAIFQGRETKKSLVGIDINLLPNDIDKLKYYVSSINDLQKAGKKVNVHLGELFDDEFTRIVLSYITPNRIGHGVLLLDVEDIVKFIRQHDICLDMCPVSNTLLGVVDWNKYNPAKKALNLGIPVTINTDNPILFNTNVKKEFELANLTPKELKIVETNSLKYRYKYE